MVGQWIWKLYIKLWKAYNALPSEKDSFQSTPRSLLTDVDIPYLGQTNTP